MTDPRLAVTTRIIELLKASGAITATVGAKVYSPIAPPQAVPPYVLVDDQGGPWTYTWRRVEMIASVYVVKSVTRDNSRLPGLQIAGAISDALQDATMDLSQWGLRLLGVRQVNTVGYPEVVDGVMHHHIGGSYRIEVTGA